MNAPDTQTPDTHARQPAQRFKLLDNNPAERPLPCSLEAEQHVLACCLLDAGQTLARCLREKISADSFYFPGNAVIFQILVDLHRTGRGLDLQVLGEELNLRRQLDQVGGWPYLLELTNTEKVSTTAHAGYMIERVREKWILRKLLQAGTDMVEKIHTYTGGLEEFTSRHSLRLQRWADFVTRLNRPGQAEEAAASKAALAEILAGKVDKSRQLSLGTAYADHVLFPLDVKNEDWLVVVAGPPSGGKSSHMRQLTAANAANGKRGAVFLLETGKRRWQWAMAASQAGANLREILEEPARVLPEKIKLFQQWDDTITSWMDERLWIYDDVFFLEDIERTIRELDRTLREKDLQAGVDPAAARGLDYVVIDYLQLMPMREKIMKREEQVAHLSRTLKRLFKAINISGIVGAQLNRRSRDEERRPRLSDLRESGAIEQDADCVLAVHTPATDRSGTAQDGERSVHEVELIQLKRRNGPANVSIDLLFFKAQTRFQDAVRKGDARPGAPKPSTGYKREGSS
jgi:replicative DNA helicase